MACSAGPARPASLERGTILVVDDDRELASLHKLVLERAGFACELAHDDVEAWEKLGTGISLVLLDIMMPGQTGPELLARMRAEPRLPDIPVVFVTGRVDAETRIQCAAMGAVDFIAKPVRSDELVDKVCRALDRRAETHGAGPDLLTSLESLDELLGVEDEVDGEASPSGAIVRSSADAPDEIRGGDRQELHSTTLERRLLEECRAARNALAEQRRLLTAVFRLHQTMRAGARPELLAAIAVSLARRSLGAEAAVLRVPAAEALRALAADPGDDAPAIDWTTRDPVARCWRQWLPTSEEVGSCVETHHPLTVGGEKLGVLSLRFAADRRSSPRLVGFFAAAAAVALDASTRLDRARAEALTDPLTGIQNRRYLENRLAEDVQRARAFRQPLSLLFLDVDHFKHVNDSLGHHVGDQLLCALSGVLASQLRSGDTIARYGGDEFVAILPDTDREAAHTVARRLQRVVGRLASEPGSQIRELTLTIGMACYPQDGERPADLVDFADAAMRRGKTAGRNRIERDHEASGPASDGGTPAVLRTLLGALDLRDRYTGRHSRRVAALAARLARRMSCSDGQVRIAAQGGLLHDIGKLHVPSEILRKPGPLDAEERQVMERHARIGADLTAAIPPLAHLASAVRSCQEHWDGQGYPDGLAGRDIPLAARIIAVADAYDAMTTDRSYRLALPADVVRAELERCAGTQFDPAVVAAMLELVRRGGTRPLAPRGKAT
jgi:diguanylate cyclase (GGDEF)-like protein/putative nucleotidyltransferase with HDIG domain